MELLTVGTWLFVIYVVYKYVDDNVIETEL